MPLEDTSTEKPAFDVDVRMTDDGFIDFRKTGMVGEEEPDEGSAIPDIPIKFGDKFMSTKYLPDWIRSMRIFIDLDRLPGEEFKIKRQFIILNPEANTNKKFTKKAVVKKSGNKVIKPEFELSEAEGF